MKQKLFICSVFLCMFIGMISAQSLSKITGVVISSEDNSPIIGASVLVKGTTIGAVTDIEGKFTIQGDFSMKTAKVVVSYVGMTTQELSVAPSMKIALGADAELLDEVIVVAYGTAKKSSFTGSASSVGQKQLEQRAVTNIMSAIEGNSPGVQVTSALGQPGSSPSIRIRGFGSINGSSTPLYVVDGAIYDGSLGDLNPNDIESMTILKDAASCALYGSSAGNGVILITTKQGKGNEGKSHVNLDIKFGVSQRGIPEYPRLNPYQYYQVAGEMYKNQLGDAAKAYANLADKVFDGYNPFKGVANDQIFNADGTLSKSITGLKWGDDLDWEDAAYRTGLRQEYNLSYSTKTSTSDSYASLSYIDEDGTQVRTDYQRISGRLNYNVYPVKWFKSGLNLSAAKVTSTTNSSTSDSSSGYANLTRFVRNIPSIYPVHMHNLATGEYILDAAGQKQYDYDNPEGSRIFSTGRDAVAEAYLNKPEFNRNMVQGKAYIDIMPLEGLTLTASGSYNGYDYRYKKYENPFVGDGATAGRLGMSSTRTTSLTFNQLIKYVKSLGKHNFDLLAGHESYKYKYNYFYSMKTAEIMSGVSELDNYVNIASLSSYTDQYTKEGYLFRLNYDYDNKYYASFSYRRDGTSVFSKDARWGNFFSAGLSWRLSEEQFIKDIEWISNLKVRASYGETGNDQLDGYYMYQTLYDLGINNKNESGIYFSTYGNENLKWETQVSTDFGVDFSLFQDKLSGTVEYFIKKSKDLLMSVPVATSSGVGSTYENIGTISNKGVEIDLKYNILQNKDFNLSVGANATFLKNEVTKMPESNPEIEGSTQKIAVGHSRYEWYLYQWKGVNPDNGDPMYVLDTEKYQVGSAADCYEYKGQAVTTNYQKAKKDWSGSAIPDVMGGFNIAASYKGIDLAVLFSYQLGGKIYDSNYKAIMANAIENAWSTDMLKAWKQAGDVTSVPRLDSSSSHKTNADATSSRWLVSSDYLALRSISLGYSLPKNLISQLGLTKCRVSLMGENLAQFNHRKGLDCLSTFSGYTYNMYSPNRTFTFNLSVGF